MKILKAVAAFVVGYAVSWFALKVFQSLTGLYEYTETYLIALFVVPVVVGCVAAFKINSTPLLDEPILTDEERRASLRRKGDFVDLKTYVRTDPNWANKNEVTDALKPDKYPSKLYVGGGHFWSEQGNILTVGGARGGKGVNLILPALLNDNLREYAAPSFIVLDPKGENCAVAAPFLKHIGYDVHVINPFEIEEIAQFGQARINPFDLFTATDKDYSKKVSAILFALIPTSTKTNSDWDDAGRDLLGAYIGHMMTQDIKAKTFMTLFNWLAYAGEKRDSLLATMSRNTMLDGTISTEAFKIIGYLSDDAGKMVAGIYKSANNGLSVFSDLQLRHTVSGSDFTLDTLTKRKTAVFVCVNPADLRRVSPWMRIVFNSLLDGLTKTYSKTRKIVMLMDEFPTIGRLQSFENNFAFLPGYNVTLWPIVQDLNQLRTLYPDSWETFVGSAHIKHWLAIGDNFTADYVRDRMPRVKDDRNPNDNSGQLKPLLESFEIRNFKGILTEVKTLSKFIDMPKLPYWERNSNGADNPFR